MRLVLETKEINNQEVRFEKDADDNLYAVTDNDAKKIEVTDGDYDAAIQLYEDEQK